MSERPTPETDAEIDAEKLCACYPNEYVDAEFARKLERQGSGAAGAGLRINQTGSVPPLPASACSPLL